MEGQRYENGHYIALLTQLDTYNEQVSDLAFLDQCFQSIAACLVSQINVALNAYTFYPRDAMLARVIAIVTCPSVCLSCLSVPLSVTSLYCVKTKKASVMISSNLVAP